MKKKYSFLFFILFKVLLSQNNDVDSFHDTQGNIEVNAGGQLQYSLPIALPPGIKSVAPQMNLVYTSGNGNGIVGYSWNLSGITSISRIGKTIEKDGEVAGVKLNYADFYQFNGQRLILSSGTYGADGATYITEKYSNVKIRSVGTIAGQTWQGPEYWEVTFEDGSQAWYGATTTGVSIARTPVEYNIVKWKDAQGNYITYNYTQANNVAVISSVQWGGNETLGRTCFNSITFNYITRDLKETSYLNGVLFLQDKLLSNVLVTANGSQFKKYVITYTKSFVNDDINQTINYQFLKSIQEYNSQNEAANPVTFTTKPLATSTQEKAFGDFNNIITTGDYNGDGLIDFIVKQPAQSGKPEGYYLYFDAMNNANSYFVYLGTSSNFDSQSILTYNIKSSDGYIKTKQGLLITKSLTINYPPATGDIELKYYSINSDATILNTYNNPLVLEYSKIINATNYVFTDSQYPQYSTPANYGIVNLSQLENPKEVDIDSDGMSELIFAVKDSRCFKSQVTYNWSCNNLGYRYIVIDNSDLQSTTSMHALNTITQKNILSKSSIMDFDNDGKQDVMFIDPTNTNVNVSFYTQQMATGGVVQQTISTPLNNVYQYSLMKYPNSTYYALSFKNTYSVKGFTDNIMFGDLNGDRNIEILAPMNKNDHYSVYNSGWSIYLNNGKILSEFCQGLSFYYKNISATTTYQDNSYPTLLDLDNDGKSELVNFYAGYNLQDKFSNLSLYNLSEFYYDQSNSQFRWQFKQNKIFSNLHGGNSLQPVYGDFRVNELNSHILFISNSLTNISDRKIIAYNHYNLSVDKNISTISQGGLNTEIDYKELDPAIPNLYASVKKEQYPYMELDKISQSYAVSQIRQAGFRKKDFRYRGMITHLHGKGMVGFRQIARSSWYSDGFESTKIWSGTEADPLNENLPIKEWSIKTNDESQIFPTDISVNNTQLISFKQTTYQTDVLTGGVKAIVPLQSTTKDFLKDVTTVNIVTYGTYYLPTKTITNINNGFAVSITDLTYIHNVNGVGKDYYLGRPQSKTETMQVYGDTKGSKEEYTYENNLLKTLKTYNQNNTGWLQEAYTYDGFGNIIQKTTSNSLDAQTQTNKTQYEDKGRFVIKKTDNLGLEKNITYNNWGQILTQTDYFGNSITNSYDNWGKLLSSTNNISGTTYYDYQKFSTSNPTLGILGVSGTQITEQLPDGNTNIVYTNTLGQKYKTITKSFGQGNYVAQETAFDALGRTIAKSEPYILTNTNAAITAVNSSTWSTIAYDDSTFPAKITSQSFNNGKKTQTSVSGNTITVNELNGYNRTTSKTTDALGNTQSSSDSGGTIAFTYNAASQQTTAEYAENVVSTSYDEWGRKATFNDPANGTYQYEYTGFGDLKREISPKGDKTYHYLPNGLLDSVEEISNDGTSTNKNYKYKYNNKAQIISKFGTANGKIFSNTFYYLADGRPADKIETFEGKEFYKTKIQYDNLGRVLKYNQGIKSNGILTEVTVENIYNTWDGTLYQLKDENSGKILWELQNVNAKGQVTDAKLGNVQIQNTYDSFGFLSWEQHKTVGNNNSIMELSYSFNAIKNELNERHHYNFGIDESFDYDDNNRLVNWTNPKTGQMSNNEYDEKGRIRYNDQLGEVNFGIGGNVYRASSIKLNPAGIDNYALNGESKLLQHITYNENNDPVKIDGTRADYQFDYGLSESRQIMYYGNNFEEKEQARFTKYYSDTNDAEIIFDSKKGEEKHILYIGGTPYESAITFIKDFDGEKGYKFLHKDYLGNILAITDEEGNAVEKRHFDAWGILTHLQTQNGDQLNGEELENFLAENSLLIDRGYTSHEHLFGVELLHMNGRLYDPLLRRFLNADENIQDPTNTQNYNKYGYVLNNPLLYSDPSGEIFGIIPIVIAAVMLAAQGVVIAGLVYTATACLTGNASKQSFMKAILTGAITGALFGGNSQLFSPGFWGAVAQGAVTGAAGGAIDAIVNGNNLLKGLATGAVIGGAMGGVTYSVRYLANGSYKANYTTTNDINVDENTNIADNPTMEKNITTARSKINPEITKNAKINNEGVGISNSKGYMMNDNGKFNVLGKTTNDFLTGRANILYSTKAASDYAILGRVMSHETAHAYSFAFGLPTLDLDGRFDKSLDTVEHLTIRKLEYTYAAKNNIWARLKNGYVDIEDITHTIETLQPAQKFLYNFLYKQFLPIFNTNYYFP